MSDLEKAVKLLLETYAWNADKSAKQTGEESLHSSVKFARKALREAMAERSRKRYYLLYLSGCIELQTYGPYASEATLQRVGDRIYSKSRQDDDIFYIVIRNGKVIEEGPFSPTERRDVEDGDGE